MVDFFRKHSKMFENVRKLRNDIFYCYICADKKKKRIRHKKKHFELFQGSSAFGWCH